ncbi:MAG TPA: FecR domain-containing protein [Saprospiraceae bacterium]|nr:FecR domain-containing protein [Saprospiraceae bacterium]
MSDKQSNSNWLTLLTNEAFIELVQQYGAEDAAKQWSDDHPTLPESDIKKAAKRVAQLSVDPENKTLSPSVKKEWWLKIEEKTSHKEQKIAVTRNLWMRWGVAASLALLMGIGYFFYHNLTWTNVQMASAEQSSIDLPDGSRVRVNASSEISYRSRSFQEKRLVRLEGEAFFEVEEGASFIVETSAGQVRVLGTAFNVRQRQGNLQVSCQSGKVEVLVAGGKKVILTKGQAVRYSKGDKEFDEYEVQDPGQIASWTRGEYMLNGVRFEEAIGELERQFDVQVDVPANLNSKTGNFYFTGSSVDSALYQLSWPLNADFRKTESGTYEIYLNK